MSKAKTPRRRGRNSRKTPPKGRMWPWYLAAVFVVGGITAYDNRSLLPGNVAAPRIVETAGKGPSQEKPARASREMPVARVTPSKFVPSVPVPDNRPQETASIPVFASKGKFFYCSPSRTDNCVVDGDTFIFKGEKIKIADIEAPKARGARCDAERLLAHDAKERLRVLLSDGDFTLSASLGVAVQPDRGKPRRVLRNGRSLGEQMVLEGVVQKHDGQRRPWCRQV